MGYCQDMLVLYAIVRQLYALGAPCPAEARDMDPTQGLINRILASSISTVYELMSILSMALPSFISR